MLAQAATPVEFSMFRELMVVIPGFGLIVGLALVATMLVRLVILPLWVRWEIYATARQQHERAMAVSHQAGWSAAEKFGEAMKDVTADLMSLKFPRPPHRDRAGADGGDDDDPRSRSQRHAHDDA